MSVKRKSLIHTRASEALAAAKQDVLEARVQAASLFKKWDESVAQLVGLDFEARGPAIERAEYFESLYNFAKGALSAAQKYERVCAHREHEERWRP